MVKVEIKAGMFRNPLRGTMYLVEICLLSRKNYWKEPQYLFQMLFFISGNSGQN